MWLIINCGLVRWLAKTLLFVTGWSQISKSQLVFLEQQKRAICIFPHSSAWELIVAIIHGLAHPEAFRYALTVMKPQPFEGFMGPWLEKLGFIPATKRENADGNFVTQTIKLLESKERFLLLIAPSGARSAHRWRSGYYWIAKQMQIPIIVVGQDYEKHIPVVGPTHLTSDYENKESLERALQDEASCIVPLIPHNSSLNIRSHRKTHLIQWYKFFCFAFMTTSVMYTYISIYYRLQLMA